MYTFIESGIRGGLSVVRHAKDNNPKLRNYNPKKIRSKQDVHDVLFSEDMHLFDTSSYLKDPNTSTTGEKVGRKFKDECASEEMGEFIGLKG